MIDIFKAEHRRLPSPPPAAGPRPNESYHYLALSISPLIADRRLQLDYMQCEMMRRACMQYAALTMMQQRAT